MRRSPVMVAEAPSSTQRLPAPSKVPFSSDAPVSTRLPLPARVPSRMRFEMPAVAFWASSSRPVGSTRTVPSSSTLPATLVPDTRMELPGEAHATSWRWVRLAGSRPVAAVHAVLAAPTQTFVQAGVGRRRAADRARAPARRPPARSAPNERGRARRAGGCAGACGSEAGSNSRSFHRSRHHASPRSRPGRGLGFESMAEIGRSGESVRHRQWS